MKERVVATVIVWVAYLTMVWFSIDKLEAWAIGLACIMMIPLIIITGGMWDMFKDSDDKADSLSTEALEKRKRERIDRVLHNLSDDDLDALRDRLSTDDEPRYEFGEDGEIRYRPKD